MASRNKLTLLLRIMADLGGAIGRKASDEIAESSLQTVTLAASGGVPLSEPEAVSMNATARVNAAAAIMLPLAAMEYELELDEGKSSKEALETASRRTKSLMDLLLKLAIENVIPHVEAMEKMRAHNAVKEQLDSLDKVESALDTPEGRAAAKALWTDILARAGKQ